MEKLNEKIHEAIEKVVEEDNILGNIDMLYKLVDIHKDLANEKYWQNKEEIMRYRYGNYGENYGRRAGYDSYGRDSYGRDNYGENSYGRRGYDTKYRGHDHLERMYDNYGRYMYGRERYGNSEDTKKSLKYMLESMEDFAKMLRDEAQSQEEVQMIRETAQRIASM